MKVLVDTNVLISAALNPDGTAAKAYFKATELPYECVLCDYCIDEFKRVVRNKLSKYVANVDSFLATALIAAKVIYAPSDDEMIGEELIRDLKDQPIVMAAINNKIDIILAGDRDFLASGIKKPMMISPTDFLMSKEF